MEDIVNKKIDYPECIGRKIRSEGKGRGLGLGKGKGPIGELGQGRGLGLGHQRKRY